jgi:hypothetical protein
MFYFRKFSPSSSGYKWPLRIPEPRRIDTVARRSIAKQQLYKQETAVAREQLCGHAVSPPTSQYENSGEYVLFAVL